MLTLGYNNRPFPSCLKPLFQNGAKCKVFDMKIIFISHANKTHLHMKGFALGLVLRVRVFETRKMAYCCAFRNRQDRKHANGLQKMHLLTASTVKRETM